MTITQRTVLLLIAFPFSATIAVAVYFAFDGSQLLAASTALGVFLVSESVLGYAASRIPAWSGRDAMSGREAEILTEFVQDRDGAYSGYVRLDGERWKARMSGAQPPPPGARVRVEDSEGLILLLSPPRNTASNTR